MRGSSNFYFNNFNSSGEQNLLHDLIIESISIYGQDLTYLPRELVNNDSLLTEDAQSKYTNAYNVVMYIDSVDGFGGDGSFMSKFGLEIRDQVVFTISQRVFNEEVGVNTNQSRPNEGDLIYFPLNENVFQIKYVDKFSMFYTLGTLPTWKITCERFEYSNEVLDTGIGAIDRIQSNLSTNLLDHALRDEEGNYLTDESGDVLVMEKFAMSNIVLGSDNEVIQVGEGVSEGSDDFIDFTEKNPFSEGNY